MISLLKNWLTGFFLFLIVFQTGGATFHVLDAKPCKKVEISCKEHQHYKEIEESCKVCANLYLLHTAFELPQQIESTIAFFQSESAISLFIPEWPQVGSQSQLSLRGPPSIG